MQQGGPIIYVYAAANGYVWADYFSGRRCRCNRVGPSHMCMWLPIAMSGPIFDLEVFLIQQGELIVYAYAAADGYIWANFFFWEALLRFRAYLMCQAFICTYILLYTSCVLLMCTTGLPYRSYQTSPLSRYLAALDLLTRHGSPAYLGHTSHARAAPFDSYLPPLFLARVSHFYSYDSDLFCSLLSTILRISQLIPGFLTRLLGLL